MLILRLPLMQDGTHQLQLTAVDAIGHASQAVIVTFTSSPPPLPAQSLVPLDYDGGTHTLTLQIT